MVLLVLIKDKTLSNRTDAESQVIAGAIASFQFNNQKREEGGVATLATMTIPCITAITNVSVGRSFKAPLSSLRTFRDSSPVFS